MFSLVFKFIFGATAQHQDTTKNMMIVICEKILWQQSPHVVTVYTSRELVEYYDQSQTRMMILGPVQQQ